MLEISGVYSGDGVIFADVWSKIASRWGIIRNYFEKWYEIIRRIRHRPPTGWIHIK